VGERCEKSKISSMFKVVSYARKRRWARKAKERFLSWRRKKVPVG
jgi:hypothetical protein